MPAIPELPNNRDPKGADYARAFIARMRAETKSATARRRMAELAVSVGNYDHAGKAVWADYLSEVTQ